MKRTINPAFLAEIDALGKDQLKGRITHLVAELDRHKAEARKFVLATKELEDKKQEGTSEEAHRSRMNTEAANRKMRAYHSKHVEPLFEEIAHAKAMYITKFNEEI